MISIILFKASDVYIPHRASNSVGTSGSCVKKIKGRYWFQRITKASSYHSEGNLSHIISDFIHRLLRILFFHQVDCVSQKMLLELNNSTKVPCLPPGVFPQVVCTGLLVSFFPVGVHICCSLLDTKSPQSLDLTLSFDLERPVFAPVPEEKTSDGSLKLSSSMALSDKQNGTPRLVPFFQCFLLSETDFRLKLSCLL